mmetsp:Transcript_78812/g.163893  ORF Transcript_78812/g.163893 Transcript_78812/m.163893 type:complete len:261 (+) Transcript_78812:48-830(+)
MPEESEDDQEPLPEFGLGEYWEKHYVKAKHDGEDTYEWLLTWQDIRSEVECQLSSGHDPEGCRLLHLGVGNSTLPEDMYEAGYTKQLCVDISSYVVDHMKARNENRPGIEWSVADITDMEALLPESNQFDIVFEKCTLDALFCHDSHALILSKTIKEAYRLTAVGGVFISISYHKPRDMMRWLKHPAFTWRVDHSELPAEPGGHLPEDRKGRYQANHLYVCHKDTYDDPERFRDAWARLLDRVQRQPDTDISDEEDEKKA